MIRISRILFIIGEAIFLKSALSLAKNITCPFKLYFKIPCPFCGMTRSFYEFLNLNFQQSINYNILTLPFIILLIIINIYFLIEIITNQNLLIKPFQKIKQKKKKYIICLIICFMISSIINQIRGI